MTSRERVERVLRHETPDRVPNAWGGCETAGLHVSAYRRLRTVLGLQDAPARVDTFMFNAVFDEEVLRAIEGDVLLIASPNMCAQPLRAKEGWKTHALFGMQVSMTEDQGVELMEDGSMFLTHDGQRYARCPAGGQYFDAIASHGLFDEIEMPTPEEIHFRDEFSEEALRQLEEIARAAYENTEYALCCGESLPDLQLTPGGMVNWYDCMINEPDRAGEFLERAVDASLKKLRQLDQAVGKYCSMLSIAHDLGDTRGVTMGAGLFRSVYKPHYKRLYQGWHEITRMKVNMHSCGSVAEVLEDLIECGVDVLNPVQLSATGMDPARLKEIAAGRLVFYGGAYDAVSTPPGTPAETVYRAVRKNIELLGAGGGYLFAGVHNTPADTPEEHLRAVLDAYRDARNLT